MIPYTYSIGTAFVPNNLVADNADLSLATELLASATDANGDSVLPALGIIGFGSILTVRAADGSGYALFFVRFSDRTNSGLDLAVQHVGGGTAVTSPVGFSFTPPVPQSALESYLMLPFTPNTTFDLYRPFGAASPTFTGVDCRHVPATGLVRSDPTGTVAYTDVLLVADTVDIRDGGARALGVDAVSYGDGDRVQISGAGGPTSFVVVWVEHIDEGLATSHKRALLLRDLAAWPGPT